MGIFYNCNIHKRATKGVLNISLFSNLKMLSIRFGWKVHATFFLLVTKPPSSNKKFKFQCSKLLRQESAKAAM
jgi:hypothetical protein